MAMVMGGVACVGAAGAAAAYMRTGRNRDEVAPVELDEEPEVIEAPKSWKESSGRLTGRDGYVFGDITRGATARVFGKGGKTEDVAAEDQGDAQFTQVQRLLRDAIRLYRARGYCGSINMTQTVAYFNESASVKVDGPAAGEPLPWQKSTTPDETTEELALTVTNDAIAAALDEEETPTERAQNASDAIAKEGQAGYVFATLLARLERRAKSWEAMSGVERLDPMLTQSAHIGFAIPVIKLGWGVSVSLTVSASSLLRWSEYEAASAAA